MDMGAVYRGTRLRITDLLRSDPDSASTMVPACPGWSVKDVAGHLAGVCADILAGNLDGVTTDPWTAAQVAARKEVSLEDTLDEWSTLAPQVEALVPMFPGDNAAQWASDAATHEHDVRGALGRPGARDDVSIEVATESMGKRFVAYAGASGLTGLQVRAGDRELRSDDGPAKATLSAEPFEFVRAVTGRRSLDQIRRLDWQGDPEPYLAAFEWGPFRPAGTDVEE